jgi:hypothetical protein
MKAHIVASTDNKFLGVDVAIGGPITLGDFEFIPDNPPISLGDGAWRLSNSNYSIDIQEVA